MAVQEKRHKTLIVIDVMTPMTHVATSLCFTIYLDHLKCITYNTCSGSALQAEKIGSKPRNLMRWSSTVFSSICIRSRAYQVITKGTETGCREGHLATECTVRMVRL